MHVLVAYGSRHGGTAAIAEAIGRVLGKGSASGDSGDSLEVDVVDVADAPIAAHYDAAVVGSGVYLGHWLRGARRWVEQNAVALANMPVWLFSSGPLGEPAMPAEEPADTAELLTLLTGRGARSFGGRLKRRSLGFSERAVVTALRVGDGDFRDWAEIEDWARGIAEQLRRSGVAR